MAIKASLDMNVNIGGLGLKNPVMTASGTFGYGLEFKNLLDLNRLGAVIVKGLSLKPSPGNPPPRIFETACGMLNAIGLENIGVDTFIENKLPLLADYDVPILVNLYETTVDGYAELAARLSGVPGVSGMEINISCPNVKAGGAAFGACAQTAAELVRAVRKRTDGFLMVKLSPNVTDVTQIACAVEDAGADAVSLINTITGMAVNIHTRRPELGNITGGLSGPAVKPVALRMVWQTVRAVKIPVVGVGGIMNAFDALEFLMVGASAVQIGTANLVHPKSAVEIIDGVHDFLAHRGIRRVTDWIGSLEID